MSETAVAANFKFGVQVDYNEFPQKCKIKGLKGRGLGHVSMAEMYF